MSLINILNCMLPLSFNRLAISSWSLWSSAFDLGPPGTSSKSLVLSLSEIGCRSSAGTGFRFLAGSHIVCSHKSRTTISNQARNESTAARKLICC
jgi:hypothetical protein